MRLLSPRKAIRALIAVALAVLALALPSLASAQDPRDLHYVLAPLGPTVGTVMLIHGGGWQASTDPVVKGQNPQRPYFAQSFGWEQHAVGYREGELGIRDLLRWVDSLMAAHPERPFCVFGRSSGGHLALVVAQRRPQIDCAIVEGPSLYLSDIPKPWPPLPSPRGRIVFGDDGAYRLSPLVHTAGITQPVLIGHLDGDTTVPIEQSQWFDRNDTTTTLQVVTGPGPHAGFTHAPNGITEESWTAWVDDQQALLAGLSAVPPPAP
jgi:acetyl esterase/lipase